MPSSGTSRFVKPAARRLIHLGRRLLRNTPLQRSRAVTWVYRFLFEQVEPPGRDIVVRYLDADYVVPTGDVTIVPSLVGGDYERSEFEALEATLTPGMNVLDVGANIGLHSVFFGKRVGNAGRVFAFEPEPKNYAYLRKNVEANHLTNVETFLMGAGSEDGILRLHLAEGSIGTHSAAPSTGSESIEVRVVQLDAFLGARADRLDLVKVDVEGYETQVLKGLEATLTRDRPILFIEFSPPLLRQCGNDPEALLAMLESLYPPPLVFQDLGKPGVPLDATARRRLLDSSSGSRNLLFRVTGAGATA